MTVPWNYKLGDENEQTDDANCIQRFVVINVIDTRKQANSFLPEYNNLHSKTLEDVTECFVELNCDIAVARKDDIQRGQSNVSAVLCYEINFIKGGGLSVHLVGLIVAHSYCKNVKFDVPCIKTCGKHRKSVRKSSCYCMSYHDFVRMTYKQNVQFMGTLSTAFEHLM